MLVENDAIGPTHFSYNESRRWFFLNKPIVNQDLTADRLRSPGIWGELLAQGEGHGRWRRPKLVPRKLVVLVDVSGSMGDEQKEIETKAREKEKERDAKSKEADELLEGGFRGVKLRLGYDTLAAGTSSWTALAEIVSPKTLNYWWSPRRGERRGA